MYAHIAAILGSITTFFAHRLPVAYRMPGAAAERTATNIEFGQVLMSQIVEMQAVCCV